METLNKWLSEFSLSVGESVDFICVSRYDSDDDNHYNAYQLTAYDENTIEWEILNRSFYSGFGDSGCPAMYAWSKSWIFIITEYDGATGWQCIPRNPISCEPEFN